MTEDEFLGWKANEQTKVIFEYFRVKREDIKELLACGSIPQENRERAIGVCHGYLDILNADFSDFSKLSNEEEDDARDKAS